MKFSRGDCLSSETEKIMRARKKIFSASFSPTVTNYLLYDKTLNETQKKEVIDIARQIALSNGHIRVYWEDFQLALKKWRESIKK